jgi:carboxylesterase type B
MVTALTASPQAKDLFQHVWVTNGAGSFENKTLDMANMENKEILNTLNCGADEIECLVDATAEDITDSIPFLWRDTKTPELPQKGEKDHSWIIIDKHILIQHPKDYWAENQLSNTVPIVFGATAQGEVNTETKEFLDWSDSNKYEGHVEGKLGSFNETLPTQVMELYNVSDHWQEYAFMISDIRTVCPVQELAQYATKHFVENVSFYVATQPKSDSLGGIADKNIDISAILGTYNTENPNEIQFIANIQNMFYTYIKTGKLPQDKDVHKGMYVVNDQINTQRNYPKCDFWKEAQDIVPNYASLD